MLTEYHEKTLSWCRSALSNLQMEEVEKEVIGQAIRDDMPGGVFDAAFGEWQQFNSSDYVSKGICHLICSLSSPKKKYSPHFEYSGEVLKCNLN